MSVKISRRDFLKAVSSWSIVGASLLVSSPILSACTYAGGKDIITKSKGHFFYAQKSLGYYFFIIQQEAMQRAVEARGYEFVAVVSNLNSSVQVKQIEEAVNRHPVAIICDPVSSGQTFANAVKKINDEGIPVGIVDTPVINGEISITVAFDNYKGGQMAAEKMISLLKKKYGEPRGTILHCYGDLNSFAWQLRKDGFENTIKKYEQIRLISIPTVGDLTKVYDATYSILYQYPELDGIHTPSETPARGIFEALKAHNKLYPIGNKEHVIVVTIDGEPIAHQWIKEGILDASISQDPIAYSEICVEMLDTYILSRKPIPKKNYINEKYYWREAKLEMTSSGPQITIPPFEINVRNVNDRRLWANIAYKDWGLTYL